MIPIRIHKDLNKEGKLEGYSVFVEQKGQTPQEENGYLRSFRKLNERQIVMIDGSGRFIAAIPIIGNYSTYNAAQDFADLKKYECSLKGLEATIDDLTLDQEDTPVNLPTILDDATKIIPALQTDKPEQSQP